VDARRRWRGLHVHACSLIHENCLLAGPLKACGLEDRRWVGVALGVLGRGAFVAPKSPLPCPSICRWHMHAASGSGYTYTLDLVGYSYYTWMVLNWKKIRKSLTCLGFKPTQSDLIHIDWELTEQALTRLSTRVYREYGHGNMDTSTI
jgi:hypothetical protein